MRTATIIIGSIGEEIDVEYLVEPGQKGSWETEPIPAHVREIVKATKTVEGQAVDLDLTTIAALGLYGELLDILNEMLQQEA